MAKLRSPSKSLNQREEGCFQIWTRGLSPNTIEAYRSDLSRFRSFVRKPLTEVTPSDIQAYQAQLGDNPNSNQRRMASLKSFYKCFVALGHIVRTPITWSRSLRIRPQYTARYLSPEIVASMMTEEPQSRNRLILHLLYACGLRVSELCGLLWGNLVSHAASNRMTLHVLGKGGKERAIPLPPDLVESLRAYRNNDTAEHDYIFTGRFGGALTRSQVLRIVRRAAYRVGVSAKVSPHWLRHAHATHSLQNGAPLHVVQHTLGHSNLQTTSGYLHVRPDESSSHFLNLHPKRERSTES